MLAYKLLLLKSLWLLFLIAQPQQLVKYLPLEALQAMNWLKLKAVPWHLLLLETRHYRLFSL